MKRKFDNIPQADKDAIAMSFLLAGTVIAFGSVNTVAIAHFLILLGLM